MDPLDVLISSHPKLFHGKAPRVASWMPTGWAPLISKLCNDIESLLGGDCDQFSVEQIKEKFGTLRFYWRFFDAGDDRELRQQPTDPTRFRSDPRKRESLSRHIRELIKATGVQCEKVCIRCGAPASPEAAHGVLPLLLEGLRRDSYAGVAIMSEPESDGSSDEGPVRLRTGADVSARLPFRDDPALGPLKLASLPNLGLPKFLSAILSKQAEPDGSTSEDSTCEK